MNKIKLLRQGILNTYYWHFVSYQEYWGKCDQSEKSPKVDSAHLMKNKSKKYIFLFKVEFMNINKILSFQVIKFPKSYFILYKWAINE